MAFDLALWLQNEDYPARLDRWLVAAFGEEGVVWTKLWQTPCRVTQREEGANYSVDLAAGGVVIAGDDEPNQGSYFAANHAKINLPVTLPPATNSRIDSVVVQVFDIQAGGTDPGVDPIVRPRVIPGVASATPAPPALPPTAILLAEITVPSGLPAVGNAQIRDRRVLARETIYRGTTPPPDPVEGLTWFQPTT
ncbi:hypothetical protein [Desertimonas flava]|uniref:hypothetical protein n=1 Tax=Desertimonas flava TaxID=2064846 RepID=UPI000E354509|nr:hypothetical protein [Desertimonas flava]